MGSDPDRRRRFANEARAAAALNHPHICTIHEVGIGSDGEPPFIAMELLEGETLRERLTRGPVDTSELVEYGIALADALETAHLKQIIHRDIKPANIVIGPRGPKILDFGLAKARSAGDVLEVTSSESLTATGQVIGSLAYMSPEQLRGETLDRRSDVFSLGLVLYEMATGRAAFTGTPASVMSAILHTDPEAPRHVRPELPPQLERTILKAIEKDRERRWQTAADLKADLKQLQGELGAQLVDRSLNRRRAPAVARRSPLSWSCSRCSRDWRCGEAGRKSQHLRRCRRRRRRVPIGWSFCPLRISAGSRTISGWRVRLRTR